MPWTRTSSSHRKMSEWTVCPSWTLKYTLKKTEASTLRCAENLHAQISTDWLTPCPQRQKGRRMNRGTLGEHLKPVVTQTGSLSKPLKDPERTEGRRRKNVTTSSFLMLGEFLRNSGGSLINFHILVHFKHTYTLRQKLVHP